MCQATVCSLCYKKSWFSCQEPSEEHLKVAFGETPKQYWCDCEAVTEKEFEYPPVAGTGSRRNSVESTGDSERITELLQKSRVKTIGAHEKLVHLSEMQIQDANW